MFSQRRELRPCAVPKKHRMLMIMSDYELYSIRQEIQTLNAEVAALKQRVKDLEDERRKI